MDPVGDRPGEHLSKGVRVALDFPQDERLSLDRRRMVSLLVPDALPDRLGLERKREAADTLQILDRTVECAKPLLPSRPTQAHCGWVSCFGAGVAASGPKTARKPHQAQYKRSTHCRVLMLR